MENSLLTVQIHYLDNIFNITNYVSILEQIPFIQAHQRFTNNKSVIYIECFTSIEFYTFVEVFNCILNGIPLMNQNYFVEYLDRLKYLGYIKLLKYFQLTYYAILDFKEFDRYLESLIDEIDKLFLLYQLIANNRNIKSINALICYYRLKEVIDLSDKY